MNFTIIFCFILILIQNFQQYLHFRLITIGLTNRWAFWHFPILQKKNWSHFTLSSVRNHVFRAEKLFSKKGLHFQALVHDVFQKCHYSMGVGSGEQGGRGPPLDFHSWYW